MALTDTPLCDFGWQAPNFTLPDPNGQIFTLQEHLGENGLLVMFICNHCPYVKRIADRLADDTEVMLQEGVNVLAVMSNDYVRYPADAPEKMLQFAKAYNFKFPYLIDEDQSVARAFDAVCTPDFFGFNNKGELQYRGRFDNVGMGKANHVVPELLQAMMQIAKTGKGPEEQAPSLGCSIKWKH